MPYSKIRKRYLLLLLLLTVGFAVSVPTYFTYRRTKAILLEEIQSNALNSAHAIATFLSADIERYRPLSEATTLIEGSELHQTYLGYNSLMRTIKEKSDATFIYTSKYLDDQASAFILDGEKSGTVLFSPFGSHDGMDEKELHTFLTGESTVSNLKEDPEWGTYLSAYAAIIDSRDRSVVGLVGVDYSEDHFDQLTSRFALLLNFSFAIFTLVTALALYAAILTIQDHSGLDELTGLGNKRAFNRTLHLIIAEAKKRNQPFVLCMLDIDCFKSINDSYGHPVGDLVLQSMGKALLDLTQRNRSCFRIGGDEFALILPSSSRLQAVQAKQELCNHFKHLDIPSLQDRKVTVSIGIGEWVTGITAETLVSYADKDLYEQKRKKACPTTP
jgi:diguanylate cyclase (GGDEF)-like protein